MSAAVVDTNILIRAYLSGNQSEDAILKKIIDNNYLWISGRKQLEEFIEVLGYKRITNKFAIEKDDLGKFCQWIIDRTQETEPEQIDICRDPDDNYILGLAVRASKRQKVYLITGDKDILDLKKKLKNIIFIRPGEFLKL